MSIVWSGTRYIMRTILIEHPAMPVCSHVTRPHNGGGGVPCRLLLNELPNVEFMRIRWDIKYYKHACKYNNLTSPPGDLRDVFLYDCVAYSTRDQKWIMAKLVDHVERKNNNKFCLHGRVIISGGVHVEYMLERIEFNPRFYF